MIGRLRAERKRTSRIRRSRAVAALSFLALALVMSLHVASAGEAVGQSQPGGDPSWRRRVRIAVVIPEVLLRRQVPDPAGETHILQALVDAGFKVLEQTQVAGMRYDPQVTAALKDAKGAADLGRKFKVDVIVIGEAFSEFTGQVSGFQSWRARLEARAIHVDSSEIICALDAEASGADTSDAVAGKQSLGKAGAKVGKQLVEKLEDYQARKEGLTAASRAGRDQSRVFRVGANNAKVQREANTASEVIGAPRNGDDLKVLEQVGNWLNVQMPDGAEGWTHQSSGTVMTADEAAVARHAPSAAGSSGEEVLTNQEIIDMVQAHLADPIIVGKIRSTKCRFDTTAKGLIALQAAGVSGEVMQAVMGATK